MSITFNCATTAHPTSFILSCYCATSQPHTVATYAEVCAFLATTPTFEGCTDPFCATLTPRITPVDGTEDLPQVNVSNTNAVSLLEALGLDRDPSGSVDAADFVARVLLALSSDVPSPAVAEVVDGNVIHCARHEGYVQDRLQQLLAVGEAARVANCAVTWG